MALCVIIVLCTGELILAKEENASQNTAVSSNYYRTQTRTKKGIQEAYSYDETYEDLGISHTLVNVCINQLLNGNVAYVYNGKTYYFNYIPNLSIESVKEFNEKGVCISAVLLLQRDTRSISYNLMYSNSNTDKLYYAWNVYDADSLETLAALMDFLASTYGRENCHIDNWIVGNEVNMPNAWNYTGTTNLDINVDIAARSLIIVDNAIKKYNSGAKAYLSLDHSWNHNDDGRGIAGKAFIDAFATRISELSPDTNWNLAYHPYAAIMTDSNIWNSKNALKYTTDSEDTQFISAKNLTVLTDYVRENFGEDVRIILSEQGFTAYGGQEQTAAAALAYTYYAAEFNDMIDAAIFRSLNDDPTEMKDKFYFGLFNSDASKRAAYNVFKYMDTDEWETYTTSCLNTIGIALWNEVVTYFDSDRFKRLPLESISIDKDGIVLAVGYKSKIKYSTYPEFAEVTSVLWSSDDENVVKVDANTGEITAVAAGRAIVTVTASDVDYAKCIVVVKEEEESRQNIAVFINGLYRAATGADANSNDLESYTERLINHSMNGVTAAYEILKNKIPSDTDTKTMVSMMYEALLGAYESEAYEEEIEKYAANIDAGMSKWRVFADLISSISFDYRCYDCDIDTGKLSDVSELSDLNMLSYNRSSDSTYIVVSAFTNMLGRKPSEDELVTYCSELLSGKSDKKNIIEEFAAGEEFAKRELTAEEKVDILYSLSDTDHVNSFVRKLWIELIRSERYTFEEALDIIVQ